MADFNGDGLPDLVVSNNHDAISVLLNTTEPGAAAAAFADEVTFATGIEYALAVGDFNGDGRPDVATGGSGPLDPYAVGILLNTTPPGAMTPSFADIKALPTEYFRDIAVGDFNGDGVVDLATANYDHKAVSVLLNMTAIGADTPSFGGAQDFTVPIVANGLLVSDFNLDGRADLAVESSAVSVLLNTAEPGATTAAFAAPQSFGSIGGNISEADFNADGRPDLAMAATSLYVLCNTTTPGGATAAFGSLQYLGAAALDVAAADFNADGRPDLVGTDSAHNAISVVLNTYGVYATGTIVDDDPVPSVQFTASTQSVSEGVGTVTITAQLSGVSWQTITIPITLGGTAQGGAVDYTISALPVSIAPGALTGTVTVSILDDHTSEPDETIALTMGTPTNAVLGGSTNCTVTIVDDDPSIGGASLVEGDGDVRMMEFTVTRHGNVTGPLTVKYSTYDGTAIAGVDYVATSGALSFEPNQVTGTISVPVIGNTLLQSDRTFYVTAGTDWSLSAPITVPSSSPVAVAAADFNRDGRVDLAVVEMVSAVQILMNTMAPGARNPSFAAQTIALSGTSYRRGVAVGDLNADGRPDLVVGNYSTSSISVLLNTTTSDGDIPSFGAEQVLATASYSPDVAVGDINADGKPDIVAVNLNSSSISVFLNNTTAGASTAVFLPQQTFTTGSSPRALAIADLDRDGKLDIVTTSSNAMAVLRNLTSPRSMTASFAAKQTFAIPGAPYCVAIDDLNADGKSDLAVANLNSGSVSVLLNKTTAPGAIQFGSQQAFATGAMPHSVIIARIDADSRPDLVVASQQSNTVDVLINAMSVGDATPAFAAEQSFDVPATPYLLAAADLNGDGWTDLAVPSSTGNAVTLFLNGYGSAAIGTILDDDPVTISAPTTPATYFLQQDPTYANIEVWPNADCTGTSLYTQPLTSPRPILPSGSGGDDTLTLGFANGSPIPAGGLTFDGGDGEDTLVVANLPGGAAVAVGADGVVFGDRRIELSGVEAVELAGTAELASLAVGAGAKVALELSGHALRVSSLELDPSARLDLGDGALIVEAEDPGAMYEWLAGRIAAARNGGWMGAGVGSAAAHGDGAGVTGVAILRNDDGRGRPVLTEFDGREVGVDVVLVKYTYNGDANLDGRIDADDYFRIDQGMLVGGAGYREGDFDYSGGVDGDDFVMIDLAFLRQGAAMAGGTRGMFGVEEIAGDEKEVWE